MLGGFTKGKEKLGRAMKVYRHIEVFSSTPWH